MSDDPPDPSPDPMVWSDPARSLSLLAHTLSPRVYQSIRIDEYKALSSRLSGDPLWPAKGTGGPPIVQSEAFCLFKIPVGVALYRH